MFLGEIPDEEADLRIQIAQLNGEVHRAAARGHVGQLTGYFEAGADPDYRFGTLGETVLHVAAREGQNAAVECILQARAAAWVINEAGATAIHLAASRNQVEVVKVLFRYFEEPFSCIADAATAGLPGEGLENDAVTCKLCTKKVPAGEILGHKARCLLRAKDGAGKTAQERASAFGADDVAGFLKAKGAAAKTAAAAASKRSGKSRKAGAEGDDEDDKKKKSRDKKKTDPDSGNDKSDAPDASPANGVDADEMRSSEPLVPPMVQPVNAGLPELVPPVAAMPEPAPAPAAPVAEVPAIAEPVAAPAPAVAEPAAVPAAAEP
eukprot:CAMPEP_0204348342 /NCGR_PEP_ID=MMETSP0469-20131031/28648_1 /ASSEMBLY_ACC=CAM_ASM_000384 /TAXON_ID=2969 /ORGANISM="Oxyrrhis marina" /LENGTH=321 /DNA_ID=CAMNT_0051334289 /DNA_START=34 /DNA_END=996 /DNA_ORIENTATION=+